MTQRKPCPTTLSSINYCRYLPSSRLVMTGRGILYDESRCHARYTPRTARVRYRRTWVIQLPHQRPALADTAATSAVQPAPAMVTGAFQNSYCQEPGAKL